MEGWLSYRATDFLLFSERVYWRLFERLNETLWPLPVLALGALAVALAASVQRSRAGLQGLTVLCAMAWGLSGWFFVRGVYAPVNWVMPYLAAFFAVQVMLLLSAASFRTTMKPSVPGYTLVLAGILWPGLAPLTGRSFSSAEVFGIAPDPTAVATLGLALMLPSPRWTLVLMIVPALWLLQSALTLWLLSGAEALSPALALTFGIIAALMSRRTRSPAQ